MNCPGKEGQNNAIRKAYQPKELHPSANVRIEITGVYTGEGGGKRVFFGVIIIIRSRHTRYRSRYILQAVSLKTNKEVYIYRYLICFETQLS